MKTNKELYAELRRIDLLVAAGRDFTEAEFERVTAIQDQIYDNDISGADGNEPLGEMHPFHTGTVGKRFNELDKSNL